MIFMGLKKFFRRQKDSLLFFLTKKDVSDVVGATLEQAGQSFRLDRTDYSTRGEHLGISYEIIEEAYTHLRAKPDDRDFDVNLIIDGISLPRYPRNPTASQLVKATFRYIISAPWHARWETPWDVEVQRTEEFMTRPGFLTMFADGDVVHPGYKNRGTDYMGTRDMATKIARKAIERYDSKREPFHKVLDIINRVYPTTNQEWDSIRDEANKLFGV